MDARARRISTRSEYARLLGAGIIFLVLLSFLAVIGFVVDNLLGTLPLFLLLGLGIGFAGALYSLYRALNEFGGG